MILLKKMSVLAFLLIFITSCNQDKKKTTAEIDENNTAEVMEVVEDTMQTPNIVEVAIGNENFTTLVAAVKSADLVKTLS